MSRKDSLAVMPRGLRATNLSESWGEIQTAPKEAPGDPWAWDPEVDHLLVPGLLVDSWDPQRFSFIELWVKSRPGTR